MTKKKNELKYSFVVVAVVAVVVGGGGGGGAVGGVEVFDYLSDLRELGQNEEALQDLNAHYKLTSLKSTAELQLTDDLTSVIYLCPNLQRFLIIFQSTKETVSMMGHF